MKISAKKGIHQLLEACKNFGLSKVVIAPGSRNAPLIVSFNQHPSFECFSIPDERVAGFFAMGMSIATGEPVGVLCTSGSAALNLAPAIAEAFYQNIPLVALTADRPLEWVGQGEGQTIDQTDVFRNYIRAACSIISDPQHKDEEWHNRRILTAAFSEILQEPRGPLHINIPLREPLYQFLDEAPHVQSAKNTFLLPEPQLPDNVAMMLAEKFQSVRKVLILVGQIPKMPEQLQQCLTYMSQLSNVVILTETSSNLQLENAISTIDRIITPLQQLGAEEYMPDLLITISGNIISRRIKTLLREYTPAEHWHLGMESPAPDTYQCLSLTLPMPPDTALKKICGRLDTNKISGDYAKKWQALKTKAGRAHSAYMADAPYSDLKVFAIIQNNLHDGCILHMGNSSPVRYIQLLGSRKNIVYQGNRGTSGIDGSTSTAAGFAYCTLEKINILITGDMAFMYDSNAFWNNHLPANLKVIVINNGGGGIFRIIQGPSATDELEEFFEASHPGSISGIAGAFGIDFFSAGTEAEVTSTIQELLKSEGPALLEIITPKHENARVLQQYFEYIKNNII